MSTHYRREVLQKLARKLQFDFSVEDRYGLESQLGEFRLYKEGYRKKTGNILRKQHELMEYDVRIFDYQYVPYGGSMKKAVFQTVFFIQSSKLGLPELWMKPETITHKLAGMLGFEDIDFVRFPKFSGQYHLTGGDEEYIRHHFTDDVLNYFTINRGWNLEGLGFYLLFYKKGTLLPPEEIEKLYHQGMEVAKLLTDEDAQNAIFGR